MKGWVFFFAALGGCGPVELLSSPPVQTCKEDEECGARHLCMEERCADCPSLEACQTPGLGTTWAYLERNGCRVCEFAPPSECTGADDCALRCYRGASCATGCLRPDCCANVCSPPGCPEPAPLGCKSTCAPGGTCGTCVTTSCRCDGDRWTCEATCADLSPTCGFE